MKNAIHKEMYNGYKITIYNDNFIYYRDVVEQTGDNVQLHCDSRSLQLGEANYTPGNYILRNIADDMKDQRLFVGDYGAHSGVWLTTYREITEQEINDFIEKKMQENAQDYADMGERREYILDDYRLNDITGTSESITMICDKDTTDDDVAGHWKLADEYVRGNCYILTIAEEKTCEHCGHVEYETIDSNSFIGGYDVEIEHAKEMINNY